MPIPSILEAFLTGMTVMACAVAALFFLRFWRRSRDRLLLIFAIAFLLMGITRVVLMPMGKQGAYNVYAYSFRLATYVLILAAIADKNRPKPTDNSPRVT